MYLKDFKYYISSIDILFLLVLLYSYYTLSWSTNIAYGNAAISLQLSTFICFIIFKSIFLNKQSSILSTIHYSAIFFGLILITYYIFRNFELITSLIEQDNLRYQRIIKQTRSIIGPKNQFGWFLVILFYLIILSYQKSRFKLLTGLFLLLCGLNMVLMGSRNAYLSFAVFSLFFVLLNKPPLKTLIKYGSAFAILIVAFALLIGPNQFINQITHQSLFSRFNIWRKSLELFHIEPLFGIGIGQYGNYRTGVDLDKTIQPHNDFIRYLIETGLIGTSLYIMLLLAIIFKCVKHIRRSEQVIHKRHYTILLSVIIGIISLSFFDEIKFKLNHQILIVLIWAMSDMYIDKAKLKKVHKYIISIVLVSASLGLIYYTYSYHKNNKVLMDIRAGEIINLQNKIAALESINQNYISHFKAAPINTQIADIYYSLNNYAKAQWLYEQALSIDPGNKKTITKYIECSFEEDDFLNSVPYIFDILDEDPCNINYQNKLSVVSPFIEEKEKIIQYKKMFKEKCL